MLNVGTPELLVILVIAQHWQADYVRQAHIREGRAAGLAPEAIDAILATGVPYFDLSLLPVVGHPRSPFRLDYQTLYGLWHRSAGVVVGVVLRPDNHREEVAEMRGRIQSMRQELYRVLAAKLIITREAMDDGTFRIKLGG